MAGNVARMEVGRSALKMLSGKPTGKRPLGRPRRRWEDNIRMDLKKIGINTRNWVYLIKDRELRTGTLQPVPLGPPSIENDAHGIEKFLLKTQVS